MGLEFNYTDGQTPLDDDEKEGLIIPTIATRNDLNEIEQQNIELAILWSLNLAVKPEVLFTEKFLKMVHQRMYANVWDWAGDFRKTNKNIGVDKWVIPTELRTLLDDAKLWYANSSYSPDESTIRFKHRLVSIHCFPNGNGRHSRLMADIIIEKIYKLPYYTWGSVSLLKHADQRHEYLSAIKAADKGDIQPLITFARS